MCVGKCHVSFCVNAALRRHEVAGDAKWQGVQGTGRNASSIMYVNDMVLTVEIYRMDSDDMQQT